MASGEYFGAFCLTESSSGSDAGALKTRAVKDGDRVCIKRLENVYYKRRRSRCVYCFCFNKSSRKKHTALRHL